MYSIHDLSRLKAEKAGEYSRLNMPLELGIDYGARLYGAPYLHRKRCLVLEKDRYEFQKAISDLAGIDIEAHANQRIRVIAAVRNWLVGAADLRSAKSPNQIDERFWDFTSAYHSECLKNGYSDRAAKKLPINAEYLSFLKRWVLSSAAAS